MLLILIKENFSWGLFKEYCKKISPSLFYKRGGQTTMGVGCSFENIDCYL